MIYSSHLYPSLLAKRPIRYTSLRMRWDENDEMGLEWEDENNSFAWQR